MMQKLPFLTLALVALSWAPLAVGDAQLRQRHLQDQTEWKKDMTCPQVLALSPEEFDLDQYISQSWFIQKQQVNPYQSENDLYCVVATYNKRWNGQVQVLNSARENSVDGPETAPDPECGIACLCAEQLWGGKLRVGPCALSLASSIVFGPYWVVAIDSNYEWAIISAGAPDTFIGRMDGKNFCTTTNSTCFLDINGAGLWPSYIKT